MERLRDAGRDSERRLSSNQARLDDEFQRQREHMSTQIRELDRQIAADEKRRSKLQDNVLELRRRLSIALDTQERLMSAEPHTSNEMAGRKSRQRPK